MTFRRYTKTIRQTFYMFGAFAIFGFIFGVFMDAGQTLFEIIRFCLILLFLAPLVAFVLLFYLGGFMDIIQMDEKGITITLIHLISKKHIEFASWENVAAIKVLKGYGGWSFIFTMKTASKYNTRFPSYYIRMGWDKKLEEYLCVNHPEIPFTPVKYGKK